MGSVTLTAEQLDTAQADIQARIWLTGKAGCGKTTAAAERVRFLLDHAEAWPQVLIFTPGRNYDGVYRDLLSRDGIRPMVTTYNSYVQNSLKLFWPLIAEKAEFGGKKSFPKFLTIEAAQIIMSGLIEPKVNAGYFSGLTSSMSRVFNQVMLALHKCAAAGIPFERYADIM